MCLAAPHTNHTQQYASPYTSPVLEDASFAAADFTSSGEAFRSPVGQHGINVAVNTHAAAAVNSIRDFFRTSSGPPSTPPPADIDSFTCALGPTDLTPISSYLAAAGVKPNGSNTVATPTADGATVALLVAPPRIPDTVRSSSQIIVAPSSKKQRPRRPPQGPGKTAMDKERLFVQHDHHDLSAEPDVPRDNRTANNILPSASFPIKLHRILEETTDAGHAHIISWQPHGRAFKIHNPALFIERIMPRYFPKMKKLTSLQRQFNLYGFERLTDGPDVGAYYHEAFLRHRPGLSAQRMVRRRVKGTGYKAASNPKAEPDLYALPFIGVITTKREEDENASFRHQKQAAPVKSNDVFYPTVFPSCSYNDGTRNEQDTDEGVVTEYTRSRTSSYYSSSEESAPYLQMALQQLVSSSSEAALHPSSSMMYAAPPLTPSHCLSQVMDPHNLSAMNTGRNNQVRNHDSIISSSSMDEFLSMPEATQDSFLQDFFATNDVTPLSPGSKPTVTNTTSNAAASQQQAGQHQHQHQRQGDHPILLEFADLWESASFHLK